MGGELGLQGLAIPEKFGGSGFTFVELGLVLEELGRALTVSPFFGSCVMAASLIEALGDDSLSSELLPGIAAGDSVAAVALAEDTGSWRVEDVSLGAAGDGDAWTLDGHKSFVLDGAAADLLLVVARTPDGAAIFVVDGGAAGLERVP